MLYWLCVGQQTDIFGTNQNVNHAYRFFLQNRSASCPPIRKDTTVDIMEHIFMIETRKYLNAYLMLFLNSPIGWCHKYKYNAEIIFGYSLSCLPCFYFKGPKLFFQFLVVRLDLGKINA